MSEGLIGWTEDESGGDSYVVLSGAVSGGEKPKKGELDDELGYSQPLPFAVTWDAADGKAELLDNPWYENRPTIQQLHEMRKTDGQVRGLYSLITLPILAAMKGATFVAEEGGEKEAEFITQMFTLPPNAGGMTVTFERFMKHLLQSIFYGFAAFEQVYWRPTEGPLKGKYTLKKLAYRPSETVSFLTDKHGGFAGLKQRIMGPTGSEEIEIPLERSLYYAVNEEERPFYGTSYFQTAFYHWDKKVKVYFLAHLAAQKAAVGTRLGTIPKAGANAAQKAAFKKALADLGVAQHIAMPEGFKVDSLKEAGGFDFLNYVNHHNSQMSKSVIAAFFDKDQGGEKTLLNFANGDDSLFLMMLQSIMGEIAATLNRYVIPKFIDWNFGTKKYPTFQWGPFTDEQKNAIRTIFDRLSTAAAPGVSKEFVLELEKTVAADLGFTGIDYEAIEARMKEQIAAEQAALAAQAALGAAGPGEAAADPLAQGGVPAPTGEPDTSLVDEPVTESGMTASQALADLEKTSRA